MLNRLKSALRKDTDRRRVDRLRPMLEAVQEHRRGLSPLSEQTLCSRAAAAYTLGGGERSGAPLVEVLALAAELSLRRLGMAPRPEQVLAVLAMRDGHVVEMATGEGKTLAAALTAFVKAVEGRSVHVITPNDYLAERDAAWMGPLFDAAGIPSAAVLPGEPARTKRRAYRGAVAYVACREVGFDVLRDQLRVRAIARVEPRLDFALIDEIDAVLIDEASTPLVVGGADPQTPHFFLESTHAIERLKPEIDFDRDERERTCALTEAGLNAIEAHLRELGALDQGSLHDEEHADLARVVHQCLRARTLFHRDRHYIVSEGGEVLPVDSHTGRALTGRRWQDGLHQAVEAKERVSIRPERAVRAMSSYEALFRRYTSLAGMTGTARGIEKELAEVFGLEVVRIPRSVPTQRVDEPDRVFATERAAMEALAAEADARHAEGQPVLVGVPTEEKALAVSRLLERRGVAHALLTARNHAREAELIARAGQRCAVTVATQMAGRGTDIRLGADSARGTAPMATEAGGPTESVGGGEPHDTELARVRALGGLRVIGLARHASRRVDDQLRGRAGRGGDPGSTCFFVSCQDDVLVQHAPPSVREALAAMARDGAPDASLPAWVDEAQQSAEAAATALRAMTRRIDAIHDEQRRAIERLRTALLTGFPNPAERPSDASEGSRAQPDFESGVRRPVQRLVAAHRAAAPAGVPEIRPAMLTREVYRLFGCHVAQVCLEGSPDEVTRRLEVELGQALSAQWTTLLDAVDDVVERAGAAVAIAFADSTTRGLGEATSLDALLADHLEQVLRARLDLARSDALPDTLQEARRALGALLLRRALRDRPRSVLKDFRAGYIEALDALWADHLTHLTALREGLGFRGWVREDPLVAFQRDAAEAFDHMMGEVLERSLASALAGRDEPPEL